MAPLPSSFKTSYRPSLVSLGPATPLSAIDRRVCPLSPGTEISHPRPHDSDGTLRNYSPPVPRGVKRRGTGRGFSGCSVRRPAAARTTHALEPGREKPAEEHAREGQKPHGDREREPNRKTGKIRHEGARPPRRRKARSL